MSRYTIVLLGLLAVMVTVYAEEGNYYRCHRDNESWNICGHLCEQRCDLPSTILCPNIPCTEYTADCRCDIGYVRDTDGSCVLRTDCKKEQDQGKEDTSESAE